MKAGWYGTVVFFVVLAGQAGDDELEAAEQLVGVLGLDGLLPGLTSITFQNIPFNGMVSIPSLPTSPKGRHT
jgi:hypothetical protein